MNSIFGTGFPMPFVTPIAGHMMACTGIVLLLAAILAFPHIIAARVSKKRGSQDRLELALEAAQMGTWELDLIHDTSIRSLQHDQIFGYDSIQPNWQFGDFLHQVLPEDRGPVLAALQEARRTGFLKYECGITWPDGSQHTIAVQGRTYYDLRGKPARMLGVVQETTERQRILEALRTNEERYRGLVENTGAWIWETDAEIRFTYSNRKVQDTLGYEPEEMIGRTPLEFVPPEEQDAVVGKMAQMASTPLPLSGFDVVSLCKDGRRVVLEVNAVPMFDTGGSFSGVRGISRDATERNRAEESVQRSEDKYRSLVSNIPDVIWTLNDGLQFTFISPNIERISGFTLNEIQGQGARLYLDSIHPDDVERVKAAIQALFAKGEPYDVECRVAKKNGEWTWIHDRALATYEKAGVWYADGLLSDISERKRVEEALHQSEEQYRSLISNIPDVVWTVDANRRLVFVSPNVERLTGFTTEEVYQGGLAMFLDSLDADDVWKAKKSFQALLANGTPFDIECRMHRKDGEWIWVHDRATATYVKDGVRYADGVLSDITGRKLAELQITQMARYDTLTGLANRAVFVESLNQAIAAARRSATSFAVLYLDLDHFKDVNDTLGHPVGDLLLQAVANRLGANVREADTVARFGGDEFAIILSDVKDPSNAAGVASRLLEAVSSEYSVGSAGHVADKILKAFSESFSIRDNEIRSAASVGIAVYGPDSTDAETILSHADVALYRAKSEGRGTYRFFTQAMDVDVRARVSLNKALREAIFADQLFLMYQPQVDIESHRIVGLEALVRWHHPVQGTVSPAKFIPEAEKSGLIVPLQRWVLREACRQIKQWLDADVQLPSIAVNLSGVQFKIPLELEKDLSSALAAFGLPPRLLELELTESVLMTAARQHNELLVRLRERGHRIAIDDFGSGYSSLDYLRQYSADRIKIAQSFTADIGIIPGNDAIVRAALGLARELGMEAVVEGVETSAQLELLKTWGCRTVQAYYFCRPLPVPDVTALLRIGKIDPAPAKPVETPALV